MVPNLGGTLKKRGCVATSTTDRSSLSPLSDSVFISAIRAKRRPFMGLFNLGNRKKSQGAKSGEYDG